MSIESTQYITREQAIDKIFKYLEIKARREGASINLESMTDDMLDKILHGLKYELDVDIFENYIITDSKELLNSNFW